MQCIAPVMYRIQLHIKVQRSSGLLVFMHNALMHRCKCLRLKGEALPNDNNTVSPIPAWLLKVSCEVRKCAARGPGLPGHLHHDL